MENQNVKEAVSICQMEYNSVRQEIRDVSRSLDENLRTGVLVIGGLAAVANIAQAKEAVYVAPTIIFFLGVLHVSKVMIIGTLGVYCQALQLRMKELVGSELVVLEWEGGFLWTKFVSASGLVQWANYIGFAVISLVFVYISWSAFLWKPATLFLHVGEFASFLAYATAMTRLYSAEKRTELLAEFRSRLPHRSDVWN